MIPASLVDRFFWRRHANPASGWSRLLATPLLLVAAYRRRSVRAVLAAGLSMALKFAFVAWAVRLYDRTGADHPAADLGLGE